MKRALILTDAPGATSLGSVFDPKVNDGGGTENLIEPSCTAPPGSCGAIVETPTGTTVMRLTTSSSSSHMSPSTTGRKRIGYVAGASGARTRKVNVAMPPGPTIDSAWVATRLGDGQPTDSELRLLSSPTTPRFTCCPRTPFVQVRAPVLRMRTVSGGLMSPG